MHLMDEVLTRDFIKEIMKSDLGYGDITTNSLINENMVVEAKVSTKEEGIFAGAKIAKVILELFDLHPLYIRQDGEQIGRGDTLLAFIGQAQSILNCERTLLNFLMRMSGIATLTSLALNIARKLNNSIRIASTRKTTPGFSYFEKKAVEIGGGDTHRFRLDDLILIKDNHIALVGDVEQAVRLAKQKTSFSKKIEVEITTPADIVKIVEAGADIVMLDNMSVSEVKQAIELLIKKGFRKNVILEVSGGITLENLDEYAETGVDIISMGVLTHSYTSLNMSLEVIS